ncbi:hypothetical protein [Roseomonas xinghualingensis]|uniref:hypothetical protein n=1 Tax=Roseomonas xinghualingensis TaxID=2986475 RepID=UPI0021F1217E|nr:hypothetical protein [Roseomonas sp. SXEYE001]MCV4210127.1 hypothetical protein [Roseomonas sp. SXEYE001]
MALINEILARRMAMPAYDTQLWTFMARANGRNLRNISDDALQERLNRIDRNIQYLDSSVTPRDDLPAERGWLSPWWWLRIRHWTVLEFEHRGLTPGPTPTIPALPALASDFKGVVAGGRKLLVRISAKVWSLELLQRGRLRFAPATSYRDAALGGARADDEMSKAYHRPGQVLKITGPRGEFITPIGDVEFATIRSIERRGVLYDVPYWLCSFSSDLDPRLFTEFPSGHLDGDACLVIFDPMAFVQRALPHLIQAAPRATKKLFPIEYFDLYHPAEKRLSLLIAKEMPYAYQREMRFALDPEGGSPLAGGDALFVEIGSIEDIAAVYAPFGAKLAGTGPDSFLA